MTHRTRNSAKTIVVVEADSEIFTSTGDTKCKSEFHVVPARCSDLLDLAQNMFCGRGKLEEILTWNVRRANYASNQKAAINAMSNHTYIGMLRY